MIYSNRSLAQRLERTEARSNADFVDARSRLAPESGACWIEIAGAYAMYDGAESPLTQTFGLGVFDNVTAAEMEKLEAFFTERRAPVFHEVSPLAELSLLHLLSERRYQPIEVSSVLYRELSEDADSGVYINPDIQTRVIEPGEENLWARVSAEGWRTEMEGLAEFMFEFGQVCAATEGGLPFLAELAGEPIAAGMFYIYDRVALLAGACTVPAGRRQGAQMALLKARLEYARSQGCDLAMMCALPGSQSQRNAEKNGFRIAYTRTKWQLRD